MFSGFCTATISLGANTGKALEASSFLYALTELLIKRGVITEKELNERKIVVAKRLMENDDIRIDCEERKHLCKAACCKMSFALSRQDIEECIVKWDLGHPYMIAKDENRYCAHLEKTGCACSIWKNRPVPCRANPELPEIFERKDAKEMKSEKTMNNGG